MDVEQLLSRARGGDADAATSLFRAVYHELRHIAHRIVVAVPSGMCTTSVVHEVYLRIAQARVLSIDDRQHFFAVAARAMRQLVIDDARAAGAEKALSMFR